MAVGYIVVVLVFKLHLTLCGPMECSLPGFFVHGISQARILEAADVSFSTESFQPRDQTHVSYMSPAVAGRFFTTEPLGKPVGLFNSVKGRFIAHILFYFIYLFLFFCFFFIYFY